MWNKTFSSSGFKMCELLGKRRANTDIPSGLHARKMPMMILKQNVEQLSFAHLVAIIEK